VTLYFCDITKVRQRSSWSRPYIGFHAEVYALTYRVKIYNKYKLTNFKLFVTKIAGLLENDP